jgi:hypothetical protein
MKSFFVDAGILLKQVFRTAASTHRALFWTTIVFSVLGFAAIAGCFIDPRTVVGEPIWLKPTKFFLSFSMFTVTAAWLLSLLEQRQRFAKVIGNLMSVALAIEMLCIAGQAARGTRSHFNFTTSFDAFVTVTMGVTIVSLYIVNIIFIVALMRQPMENKVFAWSIRLSFVVAMIGMGLGLLMVPPHQTGQLEALQHGVVPDTIGGHMFSNFFVGSEWGGHTFGVKDGGPGLPLVNWSTQGGDMRPAHFVGMHALQLLPIFGFWLSRRPWPRVGVFERLVLLVACCGAYAGLILVLCFQALRAQPIIKPDVWTWLQFGVLVAVVVGAIGFVWLRSRTKQPSDVPA